MIEDSSDDTRTHKILYAVDALCTKFDIAHPIWFENNVRDFKRFNKVRFNSDNFIHHFEYDYFEIQVIEED